MPHFTVEFWKDFTSLLPSLSSEPRSEVAMESLLNSLRRIDRRLYYHLGEHDSGTDLILSAEGNPDLMQTVLELEQSAPEATGWGVIAAYDGDLVIGRRNEDVFPRTENGDVLYQMACNGDRLWIPRAIDFSFVFTNEQSATSFAERLSNEGLKAQVSQYEGAPGYTQQVQISKHMLPTHILVSSFEARLEALAALSGGRADGWGCFATEA